MSDIDEVRQRTDIVEVVSQYLSLSKSGRNFRGLCPFHQEKTPSFFVFPERQSWHCFGACSTGGDVFSFIMKKEGVGFGDALRRLAERVGVTLRARSEGQKKEKEKLERLYEVNQSAARYFHETLLNLPAAEPARQYLVRRGVSEKSAGDFQLGFSLSGWEVLKRHLLELGHQESELLEAGLVVQSDDGKTHDRFRNRLIFPIFDVRGRVTGFGGRVLDDSLPKYLNSPQTPVFDKSRSLYAINLAREAIRQSDMVVLVEGYLDVITAHQHGFGNVIAAMGTSVTESQIDIIKRLSRNLVLSLDADAAGGEAMLRCVGYESRLEAEAKVIILPPGQDPDQVIKQDAGVFKELVGGAVPVMDYTFDMMTSGLDLTTASGKAQAVEKLLPIIAEIKDDIRRDHYLNKLARLTETSYNRIEAALSRVKPHPGPRRAGPLEVDRDLKKAFSSPLEEYCLTLLLHYPEFKAGFQGLDTEYFEDTRHREIFDVFQQSENLPQLREKLDVTLHDYLDFLINTSFKANAIERRLAECVLRLREKHLRRVAARREQVLAQESQAGMTLEGLAELQQPTKEISDQLGEVFAKRKSRAKEESNDRGR
jgi:DNA primase